MSHLRIVRKMLVIVFVQMLSLCTLLRCDCSSEFQRNGLLLHPSCGHWNLFATFPVSMPWAISICCVRAFFVRNSALHVASSQTNFAALTGCFAVMCCPRCVKSASQSGHRLGLSIWKDCAFTSQTSHNAFHFNLSCAMWAQILVSKSGNPFKPTFADFALY